MYNKIMPFITEGKTNYLYISFVAALAIIAGGLILGYYYFWIIELEARLVEIEAQLPMVKTSKGETANWKTYANTKFGYSFKFPANWFGPFGKDNITRIQSFQNYDPNSITSNNET